jgi:lipopolysaccharide biosynthesis glycosyltransferase
MPQENTHKTTDLHIAFGIDSLYLPPMAACITSIAERNLKLRIKIHVLAEGLEENDKTSLTTLAEQTGLEIELHDIAPDRLASLPAHAAYTRAIYGRLLLGEFLYGIADKVLYLDADILCLGDLSPLVSLDFHGHTIAAVADVDESTREAKIGLTCSTPYFNSGVFYMDVQKWNALNVTAKVANILKKIGHTLPFPDQDALNIALAGQVFYLDRQWNSLFDHFPVLPETVFLHYAGGKPWQMWSPTYQDARFIAALAQTPWANWQYLPTNRKQKNKQAQCYMRHGCLIKAAYWYALFLFDRKKKKAA